ncbi:MAG TPA: hypothetical protein VNQ77_11610 [Frankiaceae bacterium]|nr:hypothetical protein [Frankiaceae bacterium]
MSGRQVNVPLSEYYSLVLAQVVLRDDSTVPETLRPVIEAYLDRRLADDLDLREAVEALERSRARDKARPVTTLAPERSKRAAEHPIA